MSQAAWILEGVALGDGDEVANSLAARVIAAQGSALKIDGAATSGLTGVSNSLAYRVHEIEKHLHGYERWFGKLAVQTATDWADNNISTPFVAKSGNNAYGTDANDEALVIGTADTPTIAGANVKYDIHRLLITAVSVDGLIWKLQIILGSGTMADTIAAGQFSTVMVKIDAAAAASPSVPLDIMMPRGTCGADKVWVRAWTTTNDATISFYVGWHEYSG
jgi:hypothetical protein